MDRDLPDVVAEVTAVFEIYERALIANDVELLVDLFLDSPGTIRYGIGDMQHGHDEIARYRRASEVAAPPRDLQHTVISTFGRDVAVVNTEFVPHGTDVLGRQSQTWIRTRDGWRVACAHVSWLGGRGP